MWNEILFFFFCLWLSIYLQHSLLQKPTLCPLNCLCSFVENWLTTHVYGSISGLSIWFHWPARCEDSNFFTSCPILAIFIFKRYRHLSSCEVLSDCCLDLCFLENEYVEHLAGPEHCFLLHGSRVPSSVFTKWFYICILIITVHFLSWLLPSTFVWTHYFPAPNVLIFFILNSYCQQFLCHPGLVLGGDLDI